MRNCKSVLILILVLLTACSSASAQQPPNPNLDIRAAKVAEYRANADGSFTQLREAGTVSSLDALEKILAKQEAEITVYEGLRKMKLEDLQAAWSLWEAYREPLGKGVLTVPQAVDNIQAQKQKEIELLKSAKSKAK